MRKGFSAIELAVVLVIILVLAIMLLPALEGARQEAIKVKCMARVRQVGMAFEMYQSNHHGHWPSVRRSVSPDYPLSPDASASIAVLYPTYAPKPYLFRCPATDDIVTFEPGGRDFSNCHNFFVAPNGKATREEDEGKRPPRPPSYFYDGGRFQRHMRRDVRSSRVIYGDECVHGYWENDAGKGFWIGENNHPLGGNFLFADKHAEWLQVHWVGEPWDLGNAVPYVPNPRLRTRLPVVGGGQHSVLLDTNVFWDDWDGAHPEADADLAGMMWIDDSWKEF